jgi:hypothetical protein
MPDEQRIHDRGEQTRRSKAKQLDDELVLAGVERAARHERRDSVTAGTVVQHLGRPQGSPIRPRLRALTDAGLLSQSKCSGISAWGLSAAGRTKLRAAGEVALPESPQHRRWREARVFAEQEFERFETQAFTLTEQAQDMLVAAARPSAPDWLKLRRRLDDALWRVAATTHILREWPEPDDAHADEGDNETRALRHAPHGKAWRED